MSQNVTIAGANYPDVPSISVPKTGGGTADFVDTSDANATAGDIRQGKSAYVNGQKVNGTGTGGGSNDYFIDVTYQSGVDVYSFATDYAAEAIQAISDGANAYVRVTKMISSEPYIDTYLLHVMGEYLSGAAFLSDDGELNERQVFVESLGESGCEIYLYSDGNISSRFLPDANSSDNGKVAKVVNGAWTKGLQDYDDLTNRPCYEDHLPSETYYLPDMSTASYVSGSWDAGGDLVPIKMYRVADYFDSARFVGATAYYCYSYNDQDFNELSYLFTSGDIYNIVNGNVNVGYLGMDTESGTPFFVAVQENNTSISWTKRIDFTNYSFTATVPESGIYLLWGDISEIYGAEGYALRCKRVAVPAFTYVKKLDEKFYDKGIPAVTAANNGQVMRVVNGSWAAETDYYVATIERDYDAMISHFQGLKPGEGDGSYGSLSSGSFAGIKEALDNNIRAVVRLILTRNGTEVSHIDAQILKVSSTSVSCERVNIQGSYFLDVLVNNASSPNPNVMYSYWNENNPVKQVTISYDMENNAWVCDTSFADLISEYYAGNKYVFAYISALGVKVPLISGQEHFVEFSGCAFQSTFENDHVVVGAAQAASVFIDENDTVQIISVDLATTT